MFMNVIGERLYVANTVINNLLNMVRFFIIELLTRFVAYHAKLQSKTYVSFY